MTVVEQIRRGAGARAESIDIAGTRWPLYKLEAIAAGLLALLLTSLLAQPLQVAVLSAAAVSALVWIAALVCQATRAE